jgi:hypothetical protein
MLFEIQPVFNFLDSSNEMANRLRCDAPMSWVLVGQAMWAQPKPTIEHYADCLSECIEKELTDTQSPIIFAP